LSTEPTFIDKITTSYASRNIQVAPKEAPGKQSASKRSASKKKEEAKVAASPAELEIHFIDLSTSEEKQ
jgi:hypothetical protein